MLNAIMSLGETVEKCRTGELENYLAAIPKVKAGKTRLIVEVNFNTETGKIELHKKDSSGRDERAIALDYLWVGNTKANSEQWACTTDNFRYLLGDSLANLARRAPAKGALDLTLSKVLDHFYIENDGTIFENKTRRVAKMGMFSDIPDLTKQLDASQKKTITLQEYADHIRKNIHALNEQIVLWSVSVDGELISKQSEYSDIVLSEKSGSGNFESASEGICSFCMQKKPVSYDATKNMRFKYFITDKLSFASDLSPSGFARNLRICSDCLKRQLVSENYLTQNLKTNLGEFPIYILPSFIDSTLGCDEINKVSKRSTEAFSIARDMENIRTIERSLKNMMEEGRGNYTLTLLISSPNSSAATSKFKLAKVLQEVPVSRFITLITGLSKASADISRCLSPDYDPALPDDDWYSFGLSKLYRYTQPLVGGSKNGNARRVSLELVTDLITDNQVNVGKLIVLFTEYLRTQYLSGSSGRWDLTKSVIEMNVFLAFLGYAGEALERQTETSERMEDGMEQIFVNSKNREFYEHAMEFTEKANYSQIQKGLFFVGILMGNLESAQYKRLKSSPIFDKLNFRGVDKLGFVRFFTSLMESLKQYNLFAVPDIQLLQYLTHVYLDPFLGRDDWSSSVMEEETPFFILSGFSFQFQYRLRASGKGNNGVEENE